MKLVTFSFTKINIEKKSDSFENIKINSKINIKDISPLESGVVEDKEGVIKILFSYHLEYTPNIADIDFEGKIVLVGEQKQIKDILEKWKDKKMTEEFRILLFNLILRKANVKALELEDELKIPLHIPLPSIKKPKE